MIPALVNLKKSYVQKMPKLKNNAVKQLTSLLLEGCIAE